MLKLKSKENTYWDEDTQVVILACSCLLIFPLWVMIGSKINILGLYIKWSTCEMHQIKTCGLVTKARGLG